MSFEQPLSRCWSKNYFLTLCLFFLQEDTEENTLRQIVKVEALPEQENRYIRPFNFPGNNYRQGISNLQMRHYDRNGEIWESAFIPISVEGVALNLIKGGRHPG